MFEDDDEIPEGYVRVSDVLSMFKSFAGIDPNVLANAADRGERVHKYCEAYALNEFVAEYDEDCVGYMKSFIPWFDENVEEVVRSEKRVFNETYKFTGKMDMIVKLKHVSDLVLIDFKTPLKECKTWDLQLGAYQYLIENTDLLPDLIGHRQVIQLSKEGKPAKVIHYGNHEKAQRLFIGALELYKFFNPKKEILR